MEGNRRMSPRTLARLAAAFGVVEGLAQVSAQTLIPDRLVVPSDAAATAANILGNAAFFRLGLTAGVLAVAFNTIRTVLFYVLFRPVSRTITLIAACFGFVAIGLQAVSAVLQLPVLLLLNGGKNLDGFTAPQQQSLALVSLTWSGQAANVYLGFFGFCCMLVGYLVFASTFLPRVLGVLEFLAGVGYATYVYPPLANALTPYNLLLGVGEVTLGLWLLIFGVNVERWQIKAADH